MTKKKLLPIIAAIFSILCPGLGHVYTCQLKKGIYLFISNILLIFLCIIIFFNSFTGLLFLIVFSIIWVLYLIIDSIIIAARKKEKELKPFHRWYFYLLFIVINMILCNVIISIVSSNYFKTSRIASSSMEPTLLLHDFIVSKMSIDVKDIKSGDIVIFKSPNQPEAMSIKRCIAVAGQKVEYSVKYIKVDGVKFKNLFVNERDYNSMDSLMFSQPIIVPKDYCFVCGDYYSNSFDSRYYGCIPINSIVGKPLYIYWSTDGNRIGQEIK